MDNLLNLEPDPDNPGWLVRPASQIGRFLDVFGTTRVRVEPDGRVRIRVMPEARHTNIIGSVHGGFIMALIDQALFLAPRAMGIAHIAGGVTLEVSTHFLAPVLEGKPTDLLVELLRETRTMLFMRGTVEQEGKSAAAFSGIVKKPR